MAKNKNSSTNPISLTAAIAIIVFIIIVFIIIFANKQYTTPDHPLCPTQKTTNITLDAPVNVRITNFGEMNVAGRKVTVIRFVADTYEKIGLVVMGTDRYPLMENSIHFYNLSFNDCAKSLKYQSSSEYDTSRGYEVANGKCYVELGWANRIETAIIDEKGMYQPGYIEFYGLNGTRECLRWKNYITDMAYSAPCFERETRR